MNAFAVKFYILILVMTIAGFAAGYSLKAEKELDTVRVSDLSEPMKDIVNTCPDSGVARITLHASRENSWLEVECVQKGPVASDGAGSYSY